MPTIKSIALRAGVSHGTVSNVLNKKGNVSAEKIQLVEQAAKELGYKINVQAQQLRLGTTKKVCIILPGLTIKRYIDFYIGLESELRRYQIDSELICTDQLIYNEKVAYKKALSLNAAAIVVVSSMIKNKNIYEKNSPLIFVERKPKNLPEDIVYAGFDYEKAGRDIAERCIEKKYRNVAILYGSRKFSNYKTFTNGVVSVLDESDCEYKIYASDDDMSLLDAFLVLNEKDKFDAIVAASDEDIKYLKKAYSYCATDKKIPEVYAICSKSMESLDNICSYLLNYKLLGKEIAGFINKNYMNLENEGVLVKGTTIKMENEGFRYEKEECRTFNGDTINFLTIRNSTSEAIKLLLPEFEKETGIKVNMIQVAYDELYKMADSSCLSSAYDLIRTDMAWMDKIGKDLYCEMDWKNAEISEIMEKLIPGLLEKYSEFNGKIYGFPLDACVQMLFYRKDLFENELIKREYYEKNRKRLEIPKTFQQFNQIARFFCKKFNQESPVQYGATATYGRTFLASCDFMPHYREFGKNIFDEHGKVNVQTKEMKKALESYIETCSYSSGETYQWWQDSTKQFIDGDTAMHIVFSNYASDMLHNSDSQIIGKVGYTSIPGGNPMLGGGVIGISKFCQKYEQSMLFLKWLYRTDIAEMICYMGGYICNRNITKNFDIQERYPWIEDMEENLMMGWRNFTATKNSKFNEFEFEDMLGRTIRNVASEIETLSSALDYVQNECNTRWNE